jgi:hypothetical protein
MNKFISDLKSNTEGPQLQVRKEEHLNNNNRVKNYALVWV